MLTHVYSTALELLINNAVPTLSRAQAVLTARYLLITRGTYAGQRTDSVYAGQPRTVGTYAGQRS